MRRWMRFLPVVLLALPLTPALVQADPELNADKLAQVQKDVTELRKEIAQLRKDLAENGNMAAEELRAIRQLLERMEKRADTIRRESAYGPSGAVPGGPDPARAAIALQNDSPSAATIRINGIPYRVEAFQTRLVQGVPVGPFNYEVEVDGFGVIEPVRSVNLTPIGHRFRIYPR